MKIGKTLIGIPPIPKWLSGYKRSFGSDGPLGCYEDFEHTGCLIAWGSNLPEQHPLIYWRMKEAQEKRHFPLIVIDPRVTMLAQNADMHLPIYTGYRYSAAKCFNARYFG